jgi:hypothetical protein
MTAMTFDFAKHYRGNLTWLPERTIFLTKHGSQAYGTSIAGSDLDVKGIAIPPTSYLLGYNKSFEQAEIKGDPDVVIYDLRKFLKLAEDNNPNIIEVLFTDENDWFLTSNIFDMLREHAHSFLSRKAKHTFSGYAVSQLKRIRTHKRWLLEPPDHKPTREEFGLDLSHKAVNATDMGAYDKLIEEGYVVDGPVMHVLRKEKEYQNAMTEWGQFESWKKDRNEKRAALEAKYGYDTKHAMHLVRLLRMCREILTDGKINVKRPDAEELKAIRGGAWTYDYLIDWAMRQEDELAKLEKVSTLPKVADSEKLNDLCIKLLEEVLANGIVQHKL